LRYINNILELKDQWNQYRFKLYQSYVLIQVVRGQPGPGGIYLR